MKIIEKLKDLWPEGLSKWIAAVVVITLVFSIKCAYEMNQYVRSTICLPGNNETEEARELYLITKAESQYPFGKAYTHIDVVNAEKEWFSVYNNGETSKVVDKEGNVLLETGAEANLYYTYGDYIVTSTVKKSGVIVDRNSLDIIHTDYDAIEIHKNGQYMLGANYRWADDPDGTEERYEVQTMDGRIVRTSHMPMWLTDEENYVICYLGEEWTDDFSTDAGSFGLLNIETGEMEYLSKEGEQISNRLFGYTQIYSREISASFLLDENYEVALDGQLFYSVDADGEYMLTTAFNDWYIGKDNEMPPSRVDIWMPRIYTSEGVCIYKGSTGNRLEELDGNVIVERQMTRGQNGYVYIRFSEGGVDDEEA